MRLVRLLPTALLLGVAGSLPGCATAQPAPNPGSNTQDEIRTTFEYHYQEWKVHCRSVASSSELSTYLDSPHYKAMVDLGPRALPYLVEKREEAAGVVPIGWAWIQISGVIPDPSVYPWARETIGGWWKAGPQRIKERFQQLVEEWKSLQNSGLVTLSPEGKHLDPETREAITGNEGTDVAQTYRELRALGIAVLPWVVERLEEGDDDLLWLVGMLTHGESGPAAGVPAEDATTSCLSWWQDNKDRWTIPWPADRSSDSTGDGEDTQ